MTYNIPTIPETVTVHLGAPDDLSARNVTVSFIDYISNVASNEVYPTWLNSAISANILAQISFALNRIYTEFYRAKGYNFDITNTTAYDQRYVDGGSVFENVSLLVNELFDSYIRRKGNIEPLFAQYCDGINTTCSGLSQWGSLELAKRGLNAVEILENYYGDNIEIVENVPIGNRAESFPGAPLSLGDVSNDVKTLQLRLNRISRNYPSIPKIPLTNGVFTESTENAVLEFQKIFNLSADGIVGPATWYKVLVIYNAVKKLNELISEGLTLEDVSLQYPESLNPGDTGLYVSILQYFLNFVSAFDSRLGETEIDGVYDGETEELVKGFQKISGLPVTGIVDKFTWDALYDRYLGIINTLPEDAFEGVAKPFPGNVLSIGSEGEDVLVLQEYLNTVAKVYTEIPVLETDGIFGQNTLDAVYTFQELFGLTEDGTVGPITWALIADIYDDIVNGEKRNPGQFPGYTVGGIGNE